MDFAQPYESGAFADFIAKDFLPDDYEPGERGLEVPDSGPLRSARVLGASPSLKLSVLELSHESEGDPRVGLSRATFALMKRYRIGAALAAYHSPESHNWRLSLVTSELELDERTGKVKREFSNPRRYSFLLGKDAKVHTATAMLERKARVSDFPDLLSRFSLEVVNKDFYAEVAKLYTRLVGGTRLEGADERAYESELRLPGNPELLVREEFAVRLIGRMVFSWFLKKKGLIPEGLLSSADLAERKGYYHKRIEPLFFQALNTPQDERGPAFSTGDYGAVPFLNGGLFAPHRGDFYEYDSATGTSVHLNTLKLPDSWLKDLLVLLETYNFTVDENTAVDVDLAIDPEMLGRIFENLLAEINPETGETARHKTGSFYTPRSVVEYMVTESLVSFLLGKVWEGAEREKADEARSRLEALFSWSEDPPAFPDAERLALIRALHEMRCLDPACGSGAFPMSVLQKALHALERLDPDGEAWIDLQVAPIPDAATRAAARAGLVGRGGGYARKLGLIQNCIYGVDIQPIAVEMARLRAFLALIVDEAVDERKTNRGIEPLPNLEFKFVCADSLARLPQEANKEPLFVDSLQIPKLEEIRAEYLRASGKKKDKLKQRFIDEQRVLTVALYDFKQKRVDTKTAALSTWDPFSDEQAAWFDPFWMFGLKPEKGGYFDLVIANPPYVQLESMKEKAAEYKKENYSSFASRGDLYCLFYERGFELLKESGRLCYISSNKWMRTGYGEALRSYFLDTTDTEILIDFGDAQLFESATTYTNILLGRPRGKGEPAAAPRILRDLSRDARADSDFAGLVSRSPAKEADFSSRSFLLLSDAERSIKRKIEERGTPLKDWDISINYGIKTGLNEAFVVDSATHDRLITEDPKSAELLKPMLRGRDIKRFKADFHDLWIITAGFGSYKNLKKDYPAIYKHLASFEEQLQARGQCRYSRSNKGSTKEFPGQHHWLELDNNPTEDYFHQLEGKKVIFGIFMDKPTYTYDETGYFHNNALYFCAPATPYLAAVLNSQVVWFILRKSCTLLANGFLQALQQYQLEIPVPRIPSEEQKPFDAVVYCIMYARAHGLNEGADLLERLADVMVFGLYFPEEMKAADSYINERIQQLIIDEKFKKTDAFLAVFVPKLLGFCDSDHILKKGFECYDKVEAVKIIMESK